MLRRRLIWLAPALALMLATAGAAVARPLPAASEATLKAGKAWVAVGQVGEATSVIGAIDIAASPQKIWSILTDCEQAKRTSPNLVVCRVLDRGPGWATWEQVTRANAFIPSIRSLFRTDYTPYSRIAFRKTGGDLKMLQGEWRLEPLAGGRGTRLIYENLVAANIDMPAPVIRAGVKADCERALTHLRKAATGR
jgi:carbon monoxide dehydrogenase subunit G